MKAVLITELTGIDTLTVAEIAPPVAGPGELVIAVHSASVNFPDVLMTEGAYQNRPDLPFTPGMEAAGTVVEMGADVTGFRIGDRVLATVRYGAFAERLAVAPSQCFAIPDGVSLNAAAASGLAYQTAYFALVERGALKPGDVVVITGANGGVGLACVQLAKTLGVQTVIGCIANPAKADAVIAAGADHVILTDRPDLRDALRAEIRALTAGHGADLVIDLVGGDLLDASLRALAWRGRLVVVGFASGRIPTIKANYLLLKNISVSGLEWASYPATVPNEVHAAQHRIFELLRAGRIDPHIGAVYPLDDTAAALRLMQQRQVVGKILIKIGDDD